MGLTSILLLGLIAGLANLCGGLLILPTKIYSVSETRLKYLIALGIGFMLAVVFIEMLPTSLEEWQKIGAATAEAHSHSHDHEHDHDHSHSAQNTHGHGIFAFPMLLFLGGYLLIYVVEQIAAPHFHFDEHNTSPNLLLSSAFAAFGGFLLHTFFDGVSIYAAGSTHSHTGVLVFLAIFLHKVPEGLIVASLFVKSGKSARFAVLMSALASLVTFLGAVSGLLIETRLTSLELYLLPFVSGVTLYVAATEILPHLKHNEGNKVKSALTVCGGVALFFILHKIFENYMPH